MVIYAGFYKFIARYYGDAGFYKFNDNVRY